MRGRVQLRRAFHRVAHTDPKLLDVGMRIIPVIDIMGGIVVRAIAGRRSEYRPLVSTLTESVEPAEVARALLDATGAGELYVADLDAITGDGVPSVDAAKFGATVLLDSGLRTLDRLGECRNSRNVRPVVGTETWTVPPERWPRPFPAILSLDLFEGEPRCAWGESLDIDGLIALGVESLILLDLARVGTGRGSGTENLIRRLRTRWPALELFAGGGVRNRDDLVRLRDAGADAILVATALHDGSLLRFD